MNTKISTSDIYWLHLEGRIAHPFVVIQVKDSYAIVCGITTNQKLANMPGNFVLDIGEGNLEKESIVDVANILTISFDRLEEFIGRLSPKRVEQIHNGIKFLEKTYFENRP